jgi:hypothetical protein
MYLPFQVCLPLANSLDVVIRVNKLGNDWTHDGGVNSVGWLYFDEVSVSVRDVFDPCLHATVAQI